MIITPITCSDGSYYSEVYYNMLYIHSVIVIIIIYK